MNSCLFHRLFSLCALRIRDKKCMHLTVITLSRVSVIPNTLALQSRHVVLLQVNSVHLGLHRSIKHVVNIGLYKRWHLKMQSSHE